DRAGHRHGAVARVRCLYGAAGRDQVLRDWRRQGAERACQAHCRRYDSHRDRGAGRYPCLQGGTGRLKDGSMFDLTQRTALVTGGIGGAIAQPLHANGATVTISGTRIEMLDSLAGQLGGRVHVVRCNLTDEEDVENLVPAAEAAMGHVDILVNNAAITRDNIFMRLKDEDWNQVLAVDLTAAFRLARAAVRGMTRRRFGRIIGITSVVGVTGNAGQANYAAAKAGMIGMIKSLAQEVASRGVTVNAI